MTGLQGADDLWNRLDDLRTGKAHRRVLGQFGLLVVQRAQEKVPRKTGNLARTIRVSEVDEVGQRIRVVAGGTTQVGYAADVEFGTRPHVIMPVRRKVLAWGGARRLSGSLRTGASPEFFAKRVNHPGTRPRPYLRPAASEALKEVGLADAVVSVWNEAA